MYIEVEKRQAESELAQRELDKLKKYYKTEEYEVLNWKAKKELAQRTAEAQGTIEYNDERIKDLKKINKKKEQKEIDRQELESEASPEGMRLSFFRSMQDEGKLGKDVSTKSFKDIEGLFDRGAAFQKIALEQVTSLKGLGLTVEKLKEMKSLYSLHKKSEEGRVEETKEGNKKAEKDQAIKSMWESFPFSSLFREKGGRIDFALDKPPRIGNAGLYALHDKEMVISAKEVFALQRVTELAKSLTEQVGKGGEYWIKHEGATYKAKGDKKGGEGAAEQAIKMMVKLGVTNFKHLFSRERDIYTGKMEVD